MGELADESVHLVVTSPPYPMVAIWDDFFSESKASTYDEMHDYLSGVWREVVRALVPGGIACINIGDATRSRDGVFHLYPNHSRVIEDFERLGLQSLPYVLWKKPTTKPQYKGKGAFSGLRIPATQRLCDSRHGVHSHLSKRRAPKLCTERPGPVQEQIHQEGTGSV